MDMFSSVAELMNIFASFWEAITALISVILASTIGLKNWPKNWRFRVGLVVVFLGCLGATTYYFLNSKTEISKSEDPKQLVEFRIGSKNFVESGILAEMIAYLVRKDFPQLEIRRRYSLGDTNYLQSVLRDSDIDVYPEYTGTALTHLANLDPSAARDMALHEVGRLNKLLEKSPRANNMRALELFGFRNNYILVVHATRYQQLCKVAAPCQKTMTWFAEAARAQDLVVGVMGPFLFRKDGVRALEKVYGLSHVKFESIQHENKYQRLVRGELDAIVAYSTDPQLLDSGYLELVDDRGVWPEYLAFPLVSKSLLKRLPSLRETLRPLANGVTERDIQTLIQEALDAGITTELLAQGRTHALEKLVADFFAKRSVGDVSRN